MMQSTAAIIDLVAVRERKQQFKIKPSSVLVGTYRVTRYDSLMSCWVGYNSKTTDTEGYLGAYYVMDDFGTLVPVGARVHARNPFFLGVKLGNLSAHFEY